MMSKIEELWCVKDGVRRVRVARVTEQRSKRLGPLTVYRGEFGYPTYRESDIKRWGELTREQKARAYRDLYEARREDAIFRVQIGRASEQEYKPYIAQIKAERDAALAAIERGEDVPPPPHVWE